MSPSERLGLAEGALGDVLFALVDQFEAGLSVKDAGTGRYLHANAAMAACLGLAPDRLVGRTDAELVDAGSWMPLHAADQSAATGLLPQTCLHRLDIDGRTSEFLVVRLLVPARQGGASRRLLSVWFDQTAQRATERRLQEATHRIEQLARALALQDAAANPASDAALPMAPQAAFDAQLRRELDLSSREQRDFALVSVTLDPSSSALQVQGERGRRGVVDAVTALLRANTRAMDSSCHVEPAGFLILLSGVGLATAHARADALRRRCAAEILTIDGQALGFTVSMGIASCPHTAQDRDALLMAAETALLQARRGGGNRVALASIPFDGG